MTNMNPEKQIKPSQTFIDEIKKQDAEQKPVTTAKIPPIENNSSNSMANNTSPSQSKDNSNLKSLYGSSASSLGLQDKSTNDSLNLRTLLKKLFVPGVFLIGIIIIVMFFLGRANSTALVTKTLTNGNFHYSFKFYQSAELVKLSNGSFSYKFKNDIVAGPMPTSDQIPSSCSSIGSGWSQAFTVIINGENLPVCQAGTSNQDFSMIFTAQNSNHIFAIAYRSPQSSTIYPTLVKIFSSVTVSK